MRQSWWTTLPPSCSISLEWWKREKQAGNKLISTVFFCQNWLFLSLISDLLLAYHTASNLCCKLGSCRGVEGTREGPRHYWLCGCHLWPESWRVYCFGICWCFQVCAPIHSSLI
jgi:hypothetical protein